MFNCFIEYLVDLDGFFLCLIAWLMDWLNVTLRLRASVVTPDWPPPSLPPPVTSSNKSSLYIINLELHLTICPISFIYTFAIKFKSKIQYGLGCISNGRAVHRLENKIDMFLSLSTILKINKYVFVFVYRLENKTNMFLSSSTILKIKQICFCLRLPSWKKKQICFCLRLPFRK